MIYFLICIVIIGILVAKFIPIQYNDESCNELF